MPYVTYTPAGAAPIPSNAVSVLRGDIAPMPPPGVAMLRGPQYYPPNSIAILRGDETSNISKGILFAGLILVGGVVWALSRR